MKKFALIVAFCIVALGFAGDALAQTSPGLYAGQVPTAAQWNSYFASKQDYGGPWLIRTGSLSSQGLNVTSPTDCGGTLNLALKAPSDTAPSYFFGSDGTFCIASNTIGTTASISILDANGTYSGGLFPFGNGGDGGINYATGGPDAGSHTGQIIFNCLPSEPNGTICTGGKALAILDPRTGALGGLYVTDYVHAPGAVFSGPTIIPFGTPASSSAACTQGQVTFDAAFLYTCVATNTWRRAATSSF